MMVLATAIDFGLQNIGSFDLPPLATVTLGLVLGEISKRLNAKLQGAIIGDRLAPKTETRPARVF